METNPQYAEGDRVIVTDKIWQEILDPPWTGTVLEVVDAYTGFIAIYDEVDHKLVTVQLDDGVYEIGGYDHTGVVTFIDTELSPFDGTKQSGSLEIVLE